jgi:hypothetical protein
MHKLLNMIEINVLRRLALGLVKGHKV